MLYRTIRSLAGMLLGISVKRSDSRDRGKTSHTVENLFGEEP